MARGWESKSVGQQIEEAGMESKISSSWVPASEQSERQKLEGLRLQRARIIQELESSRNSRFRELREIELQHIDEELQRLHLTKILEG
jgi:hypothetical protein